MVSKNVRQHITMKSLRTKLVLITAGLIVLIVSVLTYTIVLNAANILRSELNRELVQNVRQGVALFSNFLEWQHVNLELWNAQPIVKVFFKSPALVTLSRSGLESYFSQTLENSPWIHNMWLLDNGRVIYDHVRLLDQPSEQGTIPEHLLSLFSQTTPFILNMERFYPESKKWVLVLTYPFSEDGTILAGKCLVLMLDVDQINNYLFNSLAIGHHGFLTFVATTPEGKIVVPEQQLHTAEQQHFAQMIAQCQHISDIPEIYDSILLTLHQLQNVPITLLGVASRNDIQLPIRELMLTSIFIGGCILAAGLVGAIVFSEKLTAPLRKLTEIMRGMTSGSVPGSVSLETSGLLEKRDELGVLATAFKMMFTRIQEYTAHLEEKVTQRTQEIKLANTRMAEEIEERKHLEDELRHAKDAAETANQAKSAFLANMSHELRSPLNAILGFAQVMARSSTLPSEHQENLGIIRRSGEHLLTLINQVLDLSKIEAGRTTLNLKNFDLHRLLHDVQDMFALRADTKGLQLLFEQDETIPQYIRTDDVKLRQVLINLLNNAIKFTEQGDVAVRVGADLRVRPKTRLHFEIADTGPGIAPNELDTVFEPFKQTDTGRQSQEGTGLGLPISRKFVQLMGGDMEVTSQLGHGTTFVFDIPCELADGLDTPHVTSNNRVIALEPGQCAADGSDRYRLLIADDKPDNRRLLSALLAPFGFELHEATNGQEAIDIWEAWKPHLIWMDMRMPVLDGYEATKYIKSHISQQSQIQTIIIAVTASAYEEERAEMLSAGCDDFLRKPFKDTEVFEMLHTHLGVRFVYEEGQQAAGGKDHLADEEGLTPEALAALSPKLIAQLKQGAEEADVDKLSSSIGQIRAHDAKLADALTRLVEDFEYDEILKFI